MSETTNHSIASRWRWLWALTLAGAIVLASGNNPAAPPVSFVGIDKVAHFGVFGLLATLVLRMPSVWRRFGGRGWLAVAAVSLFGATDEWHQSFTPGRSVEVADWIADTTGAALAVLLYLHWPNYRRLLETPVRLGRRKRTTQSAASPAAPPCETADSRR
ncbi:MAG TPA: VanZ family protein [Opitutaceae bacterium]|nr:VanZ family protein [Opitutaceae bacterium]